MSKRVWAAVLLAMTVVIALVAAIIPMRWHAANARADALADRADEAAADAPPPSYDRPPLDQPGCRREPIEAALFTELADICDDVDWEVRQALLTNARTASGSVGCLEQHGPDLERISTLGCGAFEATSAWGDPAPAYMVPAASAEDEVVHWLVAYASLQSPGRCLELVFRGLRIAQDQAARADSMALRINSVSAPFSHRDVLRSQEGSLSGSLSSEQAQMNRWIEARWVMTKEVRTAYADTPALEAALTLRSHGYGCVPVVEEGRLVGMLTESDFVEYAIQVLSDTGV